MSMVAADHGHVARLDAVDGLRGVAALTIVVYHIYMNALSPNLRILGVNVLRPLHDGWSGVNLFLVLSGFCLYWPYVQSVPRKLELRRFAISRIRRIVPAYYGSLLLVPAAFWVGTKCGFTRPHENPLNIAVDVTDVILHLTLLHSLVPSTIWSWNGVTWSLGLEWTWYLIFPLGVYASRRWGMGRFLCTAAVVTVLYRVCAWALIRVCQRHFVAIDENSTFCARSFVLGRLFEFAVGMSVARAAALGLATPAAARWALVTALLALAAAHVATPVDPMLPVRDMLYGLGYGAILLAAISPSGHLSRVLSTRHLVSVGEWSYSLYLLHMPIVVAGIAGLTANGVTGLPLFFLSLLLIIPSVAVAMMSYRVFEHPFLHKWQRKVAPPCDTVSMLAAARQAVD